MARDTGMVTVVPFGELIMLLIEVGGGGVNTEVSSLPIVPVVVNVKVED